MQHGEDRGTAHVIVIVMLVYMDDAHVSPNGAMDTMDPMQK